MPLFEASTSLAGALKRRLLWLLLPTMLLAMVGAYYGTLHFANLAFDRALARRAYALADQVRVLGGRVEVNLPKEARDILEFDPTDVLYFRLVGPDGVTIAQNAPLPLLRPPLHPGPHPIRFHTVRYNGEPVRVAVYGLSLRGTHAHGQVAIMAAETMAKRTRLAEEVLAAMALPMLALLVFIVWGLGAAVRAGLHPVEVLRAAIGARKPDDLTPIAGITVPDELRPLLAETNRLLADVSQLHRLNQQFLADAAHQLRTPLAALQARIQLLCGDTPSASYASLMGDIERQSRLVNQLLALSRAENRSRAGARALLDPSALARGIAADWAPRLLHAGLELSFEGAEGLSVRADAFSLEEALGNLLDNAIQHSGGARNVLMRVAPDGDEIVLSVADDGPGVPPAEWLHLTERFVRGTAACGQGCGLGMAIVEEIARAHGGRLAFSAGLGGHGLAANLRLPLAATA